MVGIFTWKGHLATPCRISTNSASIQYAVVRSCESRSAELGKQKWLLAWPGSCSSPAADERMLLFVWEIDEIKRVLDVGYIERIIFLDLVEVLQCVGC